MQRKRAARKNTSDGEEAEAKPAPQVKPSDLKFRLKGTEIGEAEKTKVTKEDAAVAAEAFLGFAYGSFSDDQGFLWEFGKGNPRGIKDSSLKELKQSFIDFGITPWRDPCKILVKQNYIEPGCLTKEVIQTDDGPTVKWTNEVEGQWLVILGGQHRKRVLEDREKELKLDVRRMEQTINKLYNAKRNEQEKAASLERLRHVRDKVRSVMGDPLRWLFAFYDHGERAGMDPH